MSKIGLSWDLSYLTLTWLAGPLTIDLVIYDGLEQDFDGSC